MMDTANGRKLAALMARDRIVSESDGSFAKVQRAYGLRSMRRLVGSQFSDG